MRRLHLPTALAALVLVAGCGDERPATVGRVDSTPSATPVQTPTPAPRSPEPTPTAAAPTGPLAGFPLDLDYEQENGDDHSPVEVTNQPGLHRVDYCGHLAWDPGAGTRALIGVEFRGEAEWSRGRTLVLYPTVLAATAAVDRTHDRRRLSRGAARGRLRRRSHDLRRHLDGRAVPGVDRHRRLPAGRPDPVRHRAHRLSPRARGPSRARLLRVRRGQRRQARGAQPVHRQCDRRGPPGGGPDARAGRDGSGAHLHGAFSPGIGLAYLSIAAGATSEGVAVGGTLADLRSAYPDLGHADNGLWYSDQGSTDYAFQVDESHVIDWMLVIADDQHCVS